MNNKLFCFKCEKYLDKSLFYRDRNKKSGHGSRCKCCTDAKNLLHKRTHFGLISRIAGTQRGSSKQRGMDMPNYTTIELYNWVMSQKVFHILFVNWVDSSYDKMQIPSIDRLDDYKPYTLDNIRITTWAENKQKGHDDIRNGVNNKRSKAILQYDLDGNLIKEFYSIRKASRDLNIANSCISSVCKGSSAQTKGYLFRYKYNNQLND